MAKRSKRKERQRSEQTKLEIEEKTQPQHPLDIIDAKYPNVPQWLKDMVRRAYSR